MLLLLIWFRRLLPVLSNSLFISTLIQNNPLLFKKNCDLGKYHLRSFIKLLRRSDKTISAWTILYLVVSRRWFFEHIKRFSPFVTCRTHNHYFSKRLDLNDIPYPALSAPDGAPPRRSSLPETAMDRSTVFPPKDWSVYKQAIRINNDIEGWHKYNAFNRRGGGHCALLLYLLISYSTVGEGGPTDKHHKAIFK